MESPIATSFGAIASEYNAARLGYPHEAIALALNGIEPSSRVLDLASGPGLLTAQVLQMRPDLQVVACDLDRRMLNQIQSEDRLSGVPAIQARAEKLPFGNGTIDLAMIGTAYHWFERSIADPEIARVLKPGGRIAALWDYLDWSSVPDMAELGKAIQGKFDYGTAKLNGAPRTGEWSGWFEHFRKEELRYQIDLNWKQIVAMAHSFFQYLSASKPEQQVYDVALFEVLHRLGLKRDDDQQRITVHRITYVWLGQRAQEQKSTIQETPTMNTKPSTRGQRGIRGDIGGISNRTSSASGIDAPTPIKKEKHQPHRSV